MEGKLRIAVRRYGPFEEAMRRQFASFREATGCRLALDLVPLDLHPLQQALFDDGGFVNGDWDLAFTVTDWLADAIGRGLVVDLNRCGRLTDEPDAWIPALLAAQQQGPALYGMPYHDGPECLIYRADLFDDPGEQQAFASRYGRALAPPATWPEFAEVAGFFTRPADGLYGTVFSAYPDGHNTLYDFCLHTWSRGGEIRDGRGWTVDTPAAREGLAFYRDMVAGGLAYPDAGAIDSVESGAIFRRRRVAMMVNWFGFATSCELPESPLRGAVRIAPIPSSAGVPPATLSVYWVLCLAAGSRHREEALAFLRHLATAPMDKLATLLGVVGCRRSTWNDAEVRAAQPFYGELERIASGARTLPRSSSLPRFAAIVDRVIARTIGEETPIDAITREGQQEADRLD
jgi:multiple sugar transport system substrate-binding protein